MASKSPLPQKHNSQLSRAHTASKPPPALSNHLTDKPHNFATPVGCNRVFVILATHGNSGRELDLHHFTQPALERGLGLKEAVALNMIEIVGIGPFVVSSLVIKAMGGPQA